VAKFRERIKIVFCDGLTSVAANQDIGLFDMELPAFRRLGGKSTFNCEFLSPS